MGSSSGPDFYISYSRHDEREARWVTDLLIADGQDVAVDFRTLTAGEDWRKRLDEQLRSCRCLIVLLTAAYASSADYARDELVSAIALQKPILPLRFDSTPPPRQVADILWVDLIGLSRDDMATRIRREARAILDRSPGGMQVTQYAAPPIPHEGPVSAEPSETVAEEAVPPAEPPPVRVSRSVDFALGELDLDVTAVTIVQRLLNLHPEYGAGSGELVTLDESPDARKLSGRRWRDLVRALYREDQVKEIHGRTMIYGLRLIEPSLSKPLLANGFLTALEAEMRPALADALSKSGIRLWEPDDVPTLGDRPATVDRLNRTVFASSLAEMLDDERKRSIADSGRGDSFLVHLHGPWGSGKSSLLGFVAGELEHKDPAWVVASFNAWQQERLEAPWWILMNAVRRAGVRAPFPEGWWKSRAWWSETFTRRRLSGLWRSGRIALLDVLWRLRLGWMAYLLLPLVLGALYFGHRQGFFDAAAKEDGWLTQLGNVAKPVGAILGLVLALLGAARGLSRSLSVGSARGAGTFMARSRDPMRTLKRRFERLVQTIGRPVAVMIDDLDRCRAPYVVDVLQGIQTLLVEAPVTWIVAADRRWLYDSYAKNYTDFRSVAREPGRPLGHLFLEKTFQLSVTLPRPATEVREEYWHRLIQLETDKTAETASSADVVGRARVQSGRTIESLFEAAPAGDPVSPALQSEISRRLDDPDLQRQVEHRLQPFSALLEPNPRAMKRLVNAYRIELHRLVAEGRRVGGRTATPEQLALWTILSLRWPLLADHIAEHPEFLTTADTTEMRSDLGALAVSQAVRDVIEGRGVSAALTEYAVRILVGLEPRGGSIQPPADYGHEGVEVRA